MVQATFRGFAHGELLGQLARELPTLEHAFVLGAPPAAGGGRDLPGSCRSFEEHFLDRRWEARPGLQAELDRRRPAGDDLAEIQFTSGTTGRSKGALMPYAHGHLLNERNRDLLDLDRDSTYISELPLFHINAHMTVWGCLMVGARARLEERFSASRWLERVRASGATHSSMLGVMVDLRRMPLRDLREAVGLAREWLRRGGR